MGGRPLNSCIRSLDPTREPRDPEEFKFAGINDHGCESLVWLSLVAFLEALTGKLEADTVVRARIGSKNMFRRF